MRDGTWNQLPIWVSSDGARLVRWVREHRAEEGVSRSYMRLLPFYFTWSEAAEVVLNEELTTLAEDDPRRLRVDEVIRELRDGNVIGDGGWFAYKLRTNIADVVVRAQPCLEVV